MRAAEQCGLRVEIVLEPDGRIRIVPTDNGTEKLTYSSDDIRL